MKHAALLVALVSTGAQSLALEPYSGPGAIEINREQGTIAILHGVWGEETLFGDEYHIEDLQAKSFMGETFWAIGHLTVVPCDQAGSFMITIQPADGLDPGPLETKPLDASDFGAWLEEAVQAYQNHAAFRRTVRAEITEYAVAERSGSPSIASPTDNPAGGADCPGGSCNCSGASGGSASACCPAGYRPVCTCSPCCSGSCRRNPASAIVIDGLETATQVDVELGLETP